MAKKNNPHSVHKPLPAHTYDAHPVVNSSHYNKQMVVIIISLIAIILVVLLLMFAGRFVGQAITQGAMSENSFGVYLTNSTIEPNTPFELIVKVNIGSKKTVALGFDMNIPHEMGVPEVTSLLKFDERGLVMDTHTAGVFEQATIFPDDYETGPFDIARINFTEGIATEGVYDISFSNLVMINLETGGAITPGINGPTITVETAGGSPCGESDWVVGTVWGTTCSVTNKCGIVTETRTVTKKTSSNACTGVVGKPADTRNCQGTVTCTSSQECVSGVCQSTGGTTYISGTKIKFVTPQFLTNNVFSTKVVATENLTTEINAYTKLTGTNNLVLLLKYEVIPILANGGEYDLTLTYPNMISVTNAEVLVMDKSPDENWTVHGNVSKVK